MSTELPPSFPPSFGSARPDSSGAKEVRGSAGPHSPGGERPPHAASSRPSDAPPSIPPRTGPHAPREYQQPQRPPYAYEQQQYAPQQYAAQQQYAPQQPQYTPQAPAPAPRPTTRRRRGAGRRALALILVLLLAWPVGLMFWANSKIQHVDALSGTPNTAGTTFLLVGSDSRADGQVQDGAEGQRADTIILLHSPRSGASSMISLPRDTYVEIPGHGANKLNAAFAFGGPPLLVQTVESLTGISVDHYVEIGMAGVVNIVDAVGGVELCLDYDVEDELSELSWTAGCHVADGKTALAFARMRYSDPYGDFGRQQRQRQVISAVTRAAATLATIVNPLRQVALLEAGVGTLVTDTDSGIIDLGRLALTFRAASGERGVQGAPPIANVNYQPGGVGSTVLLEDSSSLFFQKVLDGTVTQDDVHKFD